MPPRVEPPTPPVPPEPESGSTAADHRQYLAQTLTGATKRAYGHDWQCYVSWCTDTGATPLGPDPETLARYFASIAASHARSTLNRRLAAIGQAHREAGLAWAVPTLVRTTLRGIARAHPSAPRRAAALTSVEVRAMVHAAGDGYRGARDRAIILLGFAAALRRSEIVAIDRAHITPIRAGLLLHIPSSKADQEHEGAELMIPATRKRRTQDDAGSTCPVRAVEHWLEVSQTTTGPVFRRLDTQGGVTRHRLTGDAIRRILDRLATAAGITVPAHERLSPHGLRAGFITEVYKAGARDEQIMAHTRHTTLSSMRGYVRRAKMELESPAVLLDL